MDISRFSERKKRVLSSISNLSSELRGDIVAIIEIASPFVDAIKQAGEQQDSDEEAAPTNGSVATDHVSSEDPPRTIGNGRRKRRKISAKKRAQNHLTSAQNIPTNQKDDFRLELLRAEKKGDIAQVKQIEERIRQFYKSVGLKFRSSGLRIHMRGQNRGAFAARLLDRKRSKDARNKLLHELAELFGVTPNALKAELPSE